MVRNAATLSPPRLPFVVMTPPRKKEIRCLHARPDVRRFRPETNNCPGRALLRRILCRGHPSNQSEKEESPCLERPPPFRFRSTEQNSTEESSPRESLATTKAARVSTEGSTAGPRRSSALLTRTTSREPSRSHGRPASSSRSGAAATASPATARPRAGSCSTSATWMGWRSTSSAARLGWAEV
jgi:hypothetical protein